MKQEQNKMGTKPVKVLLLTMGLPMILSMVVQAFYNIVDSYFVSAIGEGADEAVHALTLAFPIQMLMVAVGVGTGIGVSAWISQYLGMNNRERASRLAGNAIFLGVCTYGLFLLFGLFLAQAYLRTQTGEPLVLELAGQYLSIVCIWSLGCNLFMTYEKLLQATGKGHFSTIAQLAGAVANIILDPILIFGYGDWAAAVPGSGDGVSSRLEPGAAVSLEGSAAGGRTHSGNLPNRLAGHCDAGADVFYDIWG